MSYDGRVIITLRDSMISSCSECPVRQGVVWYHRVYANRGRSLHHGSDVTVLCPDVAHPEPSGPHRAGNRNTDTEYCLCANMRVPLTTLTEGGKRVLRWKTREKNRATIQ